jgi:hypothetical protein
MPLPDGLLDLLRKPSPCFVATLMPDGSPQLTQTWVTTDGEHVVLNIVDGMQKAKNLVRGRVIATTTEGGRQSIDEISHKYLGIPYPNFSGNADETRVLVTIEADKVTPPARG